MTDQHALRNPSAGPRHRESRKTISHRPSILGIWRLGKIIHANKAAEVALAQPADSRHNPRWDYVIKRAIDADECPEHRRQLVQFIASAAASSHPNLVAILDGASTGDSPYIVMPRLDGLTMQQHLDSADPKPLPVCLWFIRQISQALAAMHEAGWVHGDVKPSNVIVGPQGHVTLIDLGFAARVHTLAGHRFRGTPQYAAPETLQGDLAAMPSADMFAVGRMLWESMAVSRTVNDLTLEPIAELVEQLVAPDPSRRPTSQFVVDRLLRLEIETLGRHIDPDGRPGNASKAA